MSVAVFIYSSSFENANRKLRDARANLQNIKVAAIIRVGKGRRKEASREKIVIEQLKKLIRELSAFCSDVLRLAARLEREARAELNFTARSGRLCDCAELRRVDEAVGRAEVRVVQGVKELGAELETHLLRHRELALQGEV